MAEANKEYEQIKAENKELRESTAKLEVLCSDLAQQVKDHECRILQAEPYSRKANIEIKGIPYSASVDLVKVVAKIGECLSVPLHAAHIERVHGFRLLRTKLKNNVVASAICTYAKAR